MRRRTTASDPPVARVASREANLVGGGWPPHGETRAHVRAPHNLRAGRALLALILLAGVSAAQPPAAPPDPTDALIQKALANDPDVQVARAKLALAEAEVAKARQATVGRVLSLRAQVDQQRSEVTILTDLVNLEAARHKAGATTHESILAAQSKLSTAKAALARAETELRLLTGDGPKAAVAPRADVGSIAEEVARLLASSDPDAVARALGQVYRSSTAKSLAGPIPVQIRAALDKKVRFEPNIRAMSISGLLDHLRREAGPDVAVRGTDIAPGLSLENPPRVELPIGAWFQMFVDDPANKAKLRVYVREYGLLIADEKSAPPDAITLAEFWQTRPAPAAKQPEVKQAPGKRTEHAHDKLPAVLKAKAGDTILVTLPVKAADVEDAKVGADTPAVVVRVETQNGVVLVAIRSERAGKARVTWDVTDATGRRFSERGREVEFE
jgi:hypothetical protein